MTDTQKFLILLGLSLWLLGSSAIRLWLRRRRFQQSEDKQMLIDPIGLTCQLLGALSITLALLLGAGLLLRGAPLLGTRLLALSLLISGISDTIAKWMWPTPQSGRFWLSLFQALWIVVAGLTLLGFTLYLRSVPGPNRDALQVEWPFAEQWKVNAGGRHRLTNYHHDNNLGERLAVDFVIVGPRGASLGQPIYAPVSGTVTKAVEHLSQGHNPAEGNVVVIRTDGGVIVTLAHLQTDSLMVAENDRVTAGQRIASCGDTGSAAVAHLHIHAERFDQPVPILFGPERVFPMRNDVAESIR